MRCSQEDDTRFGVDDFSAIMMILVGEYQRLLDNKPTQAVCNENQRANFLFKLASAIRDSGAGVPSYLPGMSALLRQALQHNRPSATAETLFRVAKVTILESYQYVRILALGMPVGLEP